MKRIAIVGIDGSGKTTVVRKFFERTPARDIATVCCPAYHENPNAPLGELSRDLDALSKAADAAGDFSLKAGALFLQMTLFGSVEQAMLDAYQPRLILLERHPLVDTLAYGPFYTAMVRGRADQSKESALRETLGRSFERIEAWIGLENKRLGLNLDLWGMGEYVTGLFKRQANERMEWFSKHYRAKLPEAVILLDVDPKVAAARVQTRTGEGTQELHEQLGVLEQLRASYRHVMTEVLPSIAPGIQTHVVNGSSNEDLEPVLRSLLV